MNQLAPKVIWSREPVMELVHMFGKMLRARNIQVQGTIQFNKRFYTIRWCQAMLIVGIELFTTYGDTLPPSSKTVTHHAMDIEYVVHAARTGFLASSDTKAIEWFLMLRPDGHVYGLRRGGANAHHGEGPPATD